MTGWKFQKPAFGVELVDASGATVVRVAGELDIDTAPALQTCLVEVIGRGGNVVVDLSGLTFCDASGVRVLADSAEAAAAHGSRLLLARPKHDVMRVLQITGLTHLVGD